MKVFGILQQSNTVACSPMSPEPQPVPVKQGTVCAKPVVSGTQSGFSKEIEVGSVPTTMLMQV